MSTATIASYNDTISSTTALDPYTKSFFDAWFFMSVYYLWPLWPVAMTFNITIIIVFSSTSLGTTKTTRMYYIVIAASELGVIIAKDFFYFMFGHGFYAVGLDRLIPGGVYRWTVENMSGCESIGYFWFASEACTNCTYLVLGAERFIALYFPFKARTLITKRKMTTCMACMIVGLFCYYTQFFFLERAQFGPYFLRGYSCFTGGLSETYYLVLTTLIFVFDLILPTIVTAVFSVLIVVKIKQIMSSRHKSSESSKPMTAKQLETFITPVVLSTLHLFFYVPVATLRIVATVLPFVVKLSKLQSLALTGLGFTWHAAIMPVHLVNFLVYCNRVPGFWNNAKMSLTCRWSQIVKTSES